MRHRTLSFEAIGTRWSIEASSDISDTDWDQLQKSVAKCIERFDKTYSRFRDDSWVMQLAQKGGTYDMPERAGRMIEFYDQLYKVTDGLVTPLIGQTISDAGYDAQYSLTSKVLRKPPKWSEVIRYSEQKIIMKRPALLDFGAVGKGYLVDIVGGLLEDAGISEFVINAGGDILQRSESEQSIEIGLEDPFDTSEVIGIARIQNQSLCASAGSRRAWGKYHHMINPNTLESPRDVAATWVVADTAMQADGLATALFFVPPEKLLKKFSFEYAILDKDMALRYSKDMDVKLFEAGA